MRQKNKYLIEKWNYDMPMAFIYDKFTIEGNAELIHWKRILKMDLKAKGITKYKITKIE